MKNGISAGLGVLGGAALALAFVWVRQGPEIPPVAPQPEDAAVTGPPRALPTSTTAPGAVDLAPVVRRLDELADHLRRVEAKIDAVVAAPQRTEAVDRTAVVDADSLLRAMQGAEQLRIEALSDEVLEREARQLFAEGKDDPGARQRLETLLRRTLLPEKRADLLVSLGMMQRADGGEAGLLASERTLQGVIDTCGAGSKAGIEAAYQLVWTLNKRSEFARGLALASSIANHAAATEPQKMNGRWAGAIMMTNLGDRDRARAEFEAILRDCGERPEYQWLVDDVRRRLEGL